MTKKKNKNGKKYYRFPHYLREDMDHLFGEDAYINDLSPEDADWLRRFSDVEYNANFSHKDIPVTKEQKKEIDRVRNHKRSKEGLIGANIGEKTLKYNIADHIYKNSPNDYVYDNFMKEKLENVINENIEDIPEELQDIIDGSDKYIEHKKNINKCDIKIKDEPQLEFFLYDTLKYLFDLMYQETNDEHLQLFINKAIQQLDKEYNVHINNRSTSLEYKLLCKKKLDVAMLTIEKTKKSNYDIDRVISLLRDIFNKHIFKSKNKTKINNKLKTIQLTYKKNRHKKNKSKSKKKGSKK